MASTRPTVLIVGGGYVGFHAARRIEKRLGPHDADVVLVDPDGFMVYQPLLAEVASGTTEARDIAVPIRRVLKRTRMITAHVSALDHARRIATIQPAEGPPREIAYDEIVIGLGSMSRILDVPGLTEHAVGFKTIAEALHLRDHILARLEIAEATEDAEVRRRALTFVFVGAGYAGVEALAELQVMAEDVADLFHNVYAHDMRWILVEATEGILPEVPPALSAYAHEVLTQRGIDIRLETQADAVKDGVVSLSDGTEVRADTLVWVAGVAPHPLVGELGLPVDDRGRLVVEPTLQVEGTPGAWAAGDCAAVPNAATGDLCPPTAQFATRQGRHLGDNLTAHLQGGPLAPFAYESKGELITLGRYRGVGQLRRRCLAGRSPWLLRRAYYVAAMPSANRKARVLTDWLVNLAFKPTAVQLGSSGEGAQEAFTSPPGDPEDGA